MANSRNSERNGRAAAEAQAQTESALALPLHDGRVEPGAPPSNTAPANCIEGESRVLRAGIDSLYLSFSGQLREPIEKKLVTLKALAQSDDLREQSQAICKVLENQFLVMPSGSTGFPFILRDGAFIVRLSKAESTKMPLAAVQISSRALTDFGLEVIVAHLEQVMRELGQVGESKVSRVDICCDFTSDFGFGSSSGVDWVSRSNKRNWYSEAGRFTGFVFGQGSPISARLYDKTLQIQKSKQDYLRDLWWMEGWDRECTVWRLEFQIRRAVLVELAISSYDDLRRQLGSLWRYATQNWLRLVIPSHDETRARWPTHPLWTLLQQADFGSQSTMPLTRNHSRREPLDRYFFINGLAPITSFMATKGIETFKEAGPKFLQAAEEFHSHRELVTGQNIEAYCQAQAARKAREYCTRFPYTEVKNEPDFE